LRVLAPVFRFCRNITDIQRVSSMLPIPAEMHRSSNFPMERQMATRKQKSTARRNIKKASAAAKRRRTIAHLPKSVRTALGKQAASVAKRKRKAA